MLKAVIVGAAVLTSLAGPAAAQGVDVQRLLEQGLQGRGDQRRESERDAYERGRIDAERSRDGDFERRREEERRRHFDEDRRRDDFDRQRAYEEDRRRRESGRF